MKARMLFLAAALVATGCGFTRVQVEAHVQSRITPVVPVSVGIKVDLQRPGHVPAL